jgi:hypothetical protein
MSVQRDDNYCDINQKHVNLVEQLTVTCEETSTQLVHAYHESCIDLPHVAAAADLAARGRDIAKPW